MNQITRTVIIILFVLIGFSKLHAQYPYESIKAAMVFQLTQLTHFPEKDGLKEFEVGFLGDPTTGKEFERIMTRTTILDQRVKTSSFKSLRNIYDIRVLVVSRTFNRQLKQLLEFCQQSKILLITEEAQDLKYTMINLKYLESTGRLNFEINNSNLMASGFSVAPQVLLLGGKEVDIIELFNQMRDSMDLMDLRLSNQKLELDIKTRSLQNQEIAISSNYTKIDSLNMLLDSIQLSSKHILLQFTQLTDSLKQQRQVFSSLAVDISRREFMIDSLNILISNAENQEKIKSILLDSLNTTGEEQKLLIQNQADILSSKETMIGLQSKNLKTLTLLGISLLIIVIMVFLAFRNKRRLSQKLSFLVEQKTTELVKAINRAEESDRLKSAFIANISHEIRTPLNSILGFTELLGDSDLDEIQRNKYIELVESGGSQLLSIIGNIINISLIESGELKLQKDTISLEQFLQNTHLKFKQLNVSEKINIQLTDLKPLEIATDKERLNQILDNLVGNALKYTDEGIISLGYEKIKPDMIQFKIQDSGIGISNEAHDKIFDRFFRERNGAKIISGTGLGLSITKSLVEILGGEIWFEPAPEKGTIFYFTLPIN